MVNMRAFGLISLSFALALAGAADLPGSHPACARKKGPNPAAVLKADLEAKANLLSMAAQQPGVLNLACLRQLLGPAANERHQANLSRKTYYWYDRNGKLAYELLDRSAIPGFISDATLVVHFPGDAMEFDRIEKFCGRSGKRFFDFQGHPSLLYQYGPGSQLSFAGSPQAAYAAHSAKVTYNGQPVAALPVPYQPAASANPVLTTVPPIPQTQPPAGLPPHAATGQATPSLQELHDAARNRPLDAQAHLALAEALTALHEDKIALQEYQLAASLAPRSEEVQRKAQLAISNMKSR